MAKVAVRDVDLEPIDRLEEKVKMLVAIIDRLREDTPARLDENTRLGTRARRHARRGSRRRKAPARKWRRFAKSGSSSARASSEMLAQIESLKL